MSNNLKNIMSTYANLWADVLYNKRLNIHLHKVQHDIALIGLLIIITFFSKKRSALLIEIRLELLRMRNVIKRRMSDIEQNS